MTESRYQEVYPSPPLLDSGRAARAADLLTLEYFEAEPASMPTRVFDQHHVLLNLKEEPHRVENWRDGVHRDFEFLANEIIVTPAGIESGWRWHATSRVIVITLQPEKLERFARYEVGVVLGEAQPRDLPQFEDADICRAGVMLKDALESREQGSDLIFESLARVFLVKLIQKYGLRDDDYAFSKSFSADHYRRVLRFVEERFGQTLIVEDLAREADMSPSHFARLFKATIGLSPMQFVTAFRVEQTKKRLVNPDAPLIDIALGCGFSDQAHFSRVFKQLEGVTPTQYRARLR